MAMAMFISVPSAVIVVGSAIEFVFGEESSGMTATIFIIGLVVIPLTANVLATKVVCR